MLCWIHVHVQSIFYAPGYFSTVIDIYKRPFYSFDFYVAEIFSNHSFPFLCLRNTYPTFSLYFINLHDKFIIEMNKVLRPLLIILIAIHPDYSFTLAPSIGKYLNYILFIVKIIPQPDNAFSAYPISVAPFLWIIKFYTDFLSTLYM